MTVRRRKKTEPTFWSFFKQKVFTSQTFPLIATLSIIGILFVLIRMKGVEQDYSYNDIMKKYKIEVVENKELKARVARQLSVKKLKKIAAKYNLKQPSDNQIVVIPE